MKFWFEEEMPAASTFVAAGVQPLIAAENIQKYIRKENGYHSLRAPLKATMQKYMHLVGENFEGNS